MIDVVSDDRGFFIVCPECGSQYGTVIRMPLPRKAADLPQFKNFIGFHLECGAQELEARLESLAPNWDAKVEFVRQRMAEGMGFAAIAKAWRDFEDLKKNEKNLGIPEELCKTKENPMEAK